MSPRIEDNGEATRKRDENRNSPSTMTTRAAIVLYNERFQDTDVFDDNRLSLGKLRQNVNGGFVIIFDKGPVVSVQRRLCFQFL